MTQRTAGDQHSSSFLREDVEVWYDHRMGRGARTRTQEGRVRPGDGEIWREGPRSVQLRDEELSILQPMIGPQRIAMPDEVWERIRAAPSGTHERIVRAIRHDGPTVERTRTTWTWSRTSEGDLRIVASASSRSVMGVRLPQAAVVALLAPAWLHPVVARPAGLGASLFGARHIATDASHVRDPWSEHPGPGDGQGDIRHAMTKKPISGP